MKLYIIGNGFDLYHGIKSSYKHFQEYLELNDPECLQYIEDYIFIKNENWSDFETALAELNVNEIHNMCDGFLENYGAEDWSDSYHHDYQYEINIILEMLTVTLKKNFTSWINQVQLTISNHFYNRKYLSLNINEKYLSFNYTTSLNTIYNVPNDNIIYIHGNIRSSENLIYGHGIAPDAAYIKSCSETYSKDDFYLENDEEDDPRAIEGRNLIKDYFHTNYKDVKTLTEENISFFQQLYCITNICILGHSLSEIDMPYFKELVKYIDITTVEWIISYYSETEKVSHRDKIINLGIKESLIKLKKLE